MKAELAVSGYSAYYNIASHDPARPKQNQVITRSENIDLCSIELISGNKLRPSIYNA